jgi:PAS domain S-box-containing protein
MLTNSVEVPLILVVEDDENHAELIQRSFEDVAEVYSLEVVATLREALEFIERNRPNLVLTDYRLPDGNGSDLVVAAAGTWPVIMMTSHGNEQVAVEAMKIGAQDYLVKSPQAFDMLPHTVAFALKSWSLVLARRRADDAALRAKKDWERTFDAVPDLIAIIDTNHTILRVNRPMAERCRLSVEDIIGRKCYEVVHGLHAVPFCCPSLSMLDDGMAHSEVLEEEKLGGSFDVTVSPLADEDGRITSYVHVMRDITAHKQSEKMLRESEESFRRLANELRTILNSSSVGITLVKDRTVIWVNPAFIKIFGYDEAETHNMSTLELYSDKEIYDCVGQEGYARIESGFSYSKDVMMKKKDGTAIWCNLVGQAVNPAEKADGSIWIFLDITDRVHAEQERQKLEQQFQQTQKLESLGILAGGIAHDFNNVLTIILGHCFMVKEDFGTNVTDKTHVSQIEIAANRAAELCRQMLAYAGKSPILRANVDMAQLADEIVKMLQSAIKKNVTIELDLGHNVPVISGDNAQLQQVVMNLIINASEAIDTANGTISVSLTETTVREGRNVADFMGAAIKSGNYACLEVSDDGCGMDEDVQRRIFEPFYTTKFTGRGLGMSAILGIIKSHDGALKLKSSPGVGTTFQVYLPLRESSHAVTLEQSDSLTYSGVAKGTVLLVDDEEALRTIGSTLLGAIGFSVITASNGREAVDIVRERTDCIDLVLLDFIMPVMGGVEAYHEIRSISPDIPIVICSGYSASDAAEIIDNDVHTEFVQKPYQLHQLRQAMQNLLGKTD